MDENLCLICNQNKATIGTKGHGAYLCAECVKKSETAHCPDCGDNVFLPMIGWIKDGIQAVCSEMGHWSGKLSECVLKTEIAYWVDDWM